MRKLIGCIVLVMLLAAAPRLASAQRRAAARPTSSSAQRTSFGVQLDYGSDTHFGIGARGVFGLQSLFPGVPLDGIVSFDYFFPPKPAGVSLTYWEINGNVVYRFVVPSRSSFRPYAGGGLNIAHASALGASDTKAGLNVLFGTTIKVKGTLTPFVEVRGEIGGGKTTIFTGGVRF